MGQTDEDGDSNKALAWGTVDGCRGQVRGHDLIGSAGKNNPVDVSTIYKDISTDKKGEMRQ